MNDDLWMLDYARGIDDFAKGACFDATRSDAWQAGWNTAREDDEVGVELALSTKS